MHQKLVPNPFFTFGKYLKTAIACKKLFLKIDILEEDYQKALKKSSLFFPPNPVPFNGQSYQKQKGCGTSEPSLFRLRNEFRKILLLVIYYLTKFDHVI